MTAPQRGRFDVWAPLPTRMRLSLGDDTVETVRGEDDWWSPADPALVEAAGERRQVVGAVRQCDARAEHQVAAAQQGSDVDELRRVHPAHLTTQARGAGEHERAGAAQGRHGQGIPDGHAGHGRAPRVAPGSRSAPRHGGGGPRA